MPMMRPPTIAPGTDRTDAHSRYRASATQAPGTYLSDFGVVGGLYDGDEHLIESLPKASLQVTAVPEPASMAALAIGGLALLRRRRK